jgi:CRISPR-associated protein Cmr1
MMTDQDTLALPIAQAQPVMPRGADIQAPAFMRSQAQAVEMMTLTREYTVITPIFGGGAQVRTTDPYIIRGPSIRGHLRFWWRATRGGAFNGDLAAMRKREGEIWGAAAGDGGQASKVTISVEVLNAGEDVFPFTMRPGKSFADNHAEIAPGYAAFPLQPNNQDRTIRSLCKDVEFELTFSYPPALDADVKAALWAWETFGGIGGRTRRGFGAIQPKEPLLPYTGQPEQWIRTSLASLVALGVPPSGIPHLTPNLDFVCKPGSWRQLIESYQKFRQSRNPGNERNRPGRSHWPEPDEIRRLTGRSAPKHAIPLSTTKKFPRAQFGLPIIFHFKDREDPQDTSLEGADSDRMASQLILRPIQFGGKTYQLALILKGPRLPPGGARLKNALGDPSVETDLTKSEASKITPLNDETDPLKAFLNRL